MTKEEMAKGPRFQTVEQLLSALPLTNRQDVAVWWSGAEIVVEQQSTGDHLLVMEEVEFVRGLLLHLGFSQFVVGFICLPEGKKEQS